MGQQELIPHLFRIEYQKIVSVLSKRFGFNQIEIAEDIASDTFLTAAQTWGYRGLPPNPVAWLYTVAKNKAKNHLKRNRVFFSKVTPELIKDLTAGYEQEIDLSPQNINDSQLQMMLAICHPSIPSEAQIGLSLRILCGFGIEEIADAFLTNQETIQKRLQRARDKLRRENIEIEMPDASQIESRLDNVLATIYLVFNEGYYSLSQDKTLRRELCLEAMRLCNMLVENEYTSQPSVNALLSLMCFHASRFNARLDRNGEIVLYEEQDESLWNPELINKGGYFLKQAASGSRLSKYHLEAAIAYWSTQKTDTREKWESVLHLYDQLLEIAWSPTAALNRLYAVSKVLGNQTAITEAEKLNPSDDPFYFSLLGELYLQNDNEKARLNFKKAYALTRTETGRQLLQRKIDKC